MKKNEFFKLFPGWKTPNSYGNDFADPPQKSGVYLLIRPFEGKKQIFEIMYIGSAKYLFQRYERHEVRRILTEVYGYIQFYWKEESFYKELEKKLIKQYQPKFNKQWR